MKFAIHIADDASLRTDATSRTDATAGSRRRLPLRLRRTPAGLFARGVLVVLIGLGAVLAVRPQSAPAAAEGDAKAAEGPQKVVHRVVGLFAPEREAALRKAVEKVEGVQLVSVDFDYAEATFAYDVARTFQGATPQQCTEKLNEWVRNASNQTLGVKSARTTPREKLDRFEIVVGLLDCDACCLGVHDILAEQDGVEQAVVNPKDGRIKVLVDPAKTDKSKLEAALRQREVTVNP